MVRLPEGYCIDSTEVTRAQYQAWLDTNPSTANQIADCAWNTSFTPDFPCGVYNYVCQTDCANHPRACVDWCDAYAYCQAVGKRLCGRIGGGSNAFDDYDRRDLSQWYSACSSHGTFEYCYGNTADDQVCWGPNHPYTSLMTVPVGSMSGCQSPLPAYAGVFDLSGNVSEWEDSCNGPGESAKCRVRGGAGASGSLTCASDSAPPRSYIDYMIGFRCCSSP